MKKIVLIMALIVSVIVTFATCKSPKPVKTIENMKSAIVGETEANAKYALYAQRALEEGYPNISKLFSATSTAEAIHLKNHNAVLAKIGEVPYVPIADAIKVDSTLTNLRNAIDGEASESSTMYPDFIATAKEEKSNDALNSLTWAEQAEKKHGQMYVYAFDILKTTGSDNTVSPIWYVCPKCGNIYNSVDGVDNCEVCGTKSSLFEVI